MLRSGRSAESVAAEAGVDAEWVARFAMPVFAEQARVIDAAPRRSPALRLGPPAVPLGQAVYRNLAARGITATVDELDGGWSTRQSADGRWLVTFAYTSRGKAAEGRGRWTCAGTRSRPSTGWPASSPQPARALKLPPVPSPSKLTTKRPPPTSPPTATEPTPARCPRPASRRPPSWPRRPSAGRSKRSTEAARKASATKPKKPKPTPEARAGRTGRGVEGGRRRHRGAGGGGGAAARRRHRRRSAASVPATPTARRGAPQGGGARPPPSEWGARPAGGWGRDRPPRFPGVRGTPRPPVPVSPVGWGGEPPPPPERPARTVDDAPAWPLPARPPGPARPTTLPPAGNVRRPAPTLLPPDEHRGGPPRPGAVSHPRPPARPGSQTGRDPA